MLSLRSDKSVEHFSFLIKHWIILILHCLLPCLLACCCLLPWPCWHSTRQIKRGPTPRGHNLKRVPLTRVALYQSDWKYFLPTSPQAILLLLHIYTPKNMCSLVIYITLPKILFGFVVLSIMTLIFNFFIICLLCAVLCTKKSTTNKQIIKLSK